MEDGPTFICDEAEQEAARRTRGLLLASARLREVPVPLQNDGDRDAPKCRVFTRAALLPSLGSELERAVLLVSSTEGRATRNAAPKLVGVVRNA